MRWQDKLAIGFVAVIAGASATPLKSQEVGKVLASPDQVVAIRAGRLFDAKSGSVLNNQVVMIKGDRIANVGAAAQIPAGARVIDLSSATVLPGMIDTHVHLNTAGPTTPAQRALRAL